MSDRPRADLGRPAHVARVANVGFFCDLRVPGELGVCLSAMEFRVLGPVEVWAGTTRSTRVRPVSGGSWRRWPSMPGAPSRWTPSSTGCGDRRRPAAPATPCTCTSVGSGACSTRHAGGAGARLLLRSGGYLLDTDPDTVDALRFRRLVAGRGTRRHRPGRSPCARRWTSGAAPRWPTCPGSGPTGSGTAGSGSGSTRSSRGRRRSCGSAGADHVLATVGELVTEHPLVEPLIAVQMRALAAAGRGAEALDVLRPDPPAARRAARRRPGPGAARPAPGGAARRARRAASRTGAGRAGRPAETGRRQPPGAGRTAYRPSFRWTCSASPAAPTSSPTSTRSSPPPRSSAPRW